MIAPAFALSSPISTSCAKDGKHHFISSTTYGHPTLCLHQQQTLVATKTKTTNPILNSPGRLFCVWQVNELQVGTPDAADGCGVGSAGMVHIGRARQLHHIVGCEMLWYKPRTTIWNLDAGTGEMISMGAMAKVGLIEQLLLPSGASVPWLGGGEYYVCIFSNTSALICKMQIIRIVSALYCICLQRVSIWRKTFGH
jgi:hypothetical protein